MLFSLSHLMICRVSLFLGCKHNNTWCRSRIKSRLTLSHVIQHNSLFRLQFSIISGNQTCKTTRIPSQKNESDVVGSENIDWFSSSCNSNFKIQLNVEPRMLLHFNASTDFFFVWTPWFIWTLLVDHHSKHLKKNSRDVFFSLFSNEFHTWMSKCRHRELMIEWNAVGIWLWFSS